MLIPLFSGFEEIMGLAFFIEIFDSKNN